MISWLGPFAFWAQKSSCSTLGMCSLSPTGHLLCAEHIFPLEEANGWILLFQVLERPASCDEDSGVPLSGLYRAGIGAPINFRKDLGIGLKVSNKVVREWLEQNVDPIFAL